MAARLIRQLGDPILREVCAPVGDLAAVAPLLEDLRDTLHEFRRTHGFGRGISAPQVGVPLRVVYLELEATSYSLLNPEYLRRSGEAFTLWDDCFSFPDLLVRLERSVTVEVRYWDERGREKTLNAQQALSELLQHELDHLDGILAVDRAIDRQSLCLRSEWERQHGPWRRVRGERAAL